MFKAVSVLKEKMVETRLRIKNLDNNDSPKYIKIVNAIKEAVDINELRIGDRIPSINEFSKDYKVSRDTVYKAYVLLKEEGYVNSTPNKGYYITENRKKVLLLISTFKAYKEVFYHSFMSCLPNNVVIDLQFHHYNIKNFKSMLNADNGKYFKYIVMGFDHPDVNAALSKIEREKLLLIDWKANLGLDVNYVFQDFGKSFYSCLQDAKNAFSKYSKLVFVYPEFTYHPYESVDYFEKFCISNNFEYDVCKKSSCLKVEKGTAYISVNDRILYELLSQCSDLNFEVGREVGILSYNDTPLKKFTYKGISVISIDFKEFGAEVAEFVSSTTPLQRYLTTHLILRDSL